MIRPTTTERSNLNGTATAWKTDARHGAGTYASPVVGSLSASSVGSYPAPADGRSWPPNGTGIAACTWEHQNGMSTKET